MKVLIVGSARHVDTTADNEAASPSAAEFRKACEEIGEALARAGIHMVVGSTSRSTADRWVLRGASAVVGTHEVTVVRPAGRAQVDDIAAFGAAGQFKVRYRALSRSSWSGGRIAQVSAADCVLAIGGSKGTLQTCQTAVDMEVPVLAIPSFSGAAAEVCSELVPFYERLGARGEAIGQLRQPWKSSNATVVSDLLPVLRKSRVFARSPLAPELWSLAINVSLFVAWVGLFVGQWGVNAQMALFALLATSSFLGTSLRNALRLVADPSLHISHRQIVAEINAGLGVAFALSLLYLGGTLAFTGSVSGLSTGSQDAYQRIALLLGVVGITAGWTLENTARRVSDVISEPLLLGK